MNTDHQSNVDLSDARRILPSFVVGNGSSSPARPPTIAVDDYIAGQLLYPESNEPDRPVSLYLNSLDGPLSAMAAIYDTMQYIRPPAHTLRRAIR
jgi:ATP-dependent protease ClpP protease subunit